MNKKLARRIFSNKTTVRNMLIIVMALVLGFTGGFLYAEHRDSEAGQMAPYPIHLCGCPIMTPDNANAAYACRCSR